MSKEKYYEIFLDENNRISPESITYFTSKHIYNELSKKDSVKNIVLSDIIGNYSYKFDKLFNSCNDVLGFVNDDIIDLFNFTYPHLQKIIKNPKSKIVKEKKMINKEKLKSIDANTFKWLGTKPGVNIREKLANTDKVLSTVKVFSNDTKENQVVKSFFKMIYSLLLSKFEFMHNNDEVFNEESYIEKEKKLKLLLNKTKIIINDIFGDVSNKEHSVPNNTLINNVDYHSIWESYRNLKTISVDLDYSRNYFKYLFKLIMLCFINSKEYSVINKQLNLFDDMENCIVYKIDNNIITEIQFDIDTNMAIFVNKYSVVDNTYEKTEEKEYVFDGTFVSLNNVDGRGLYFELQMDGDKFVSSFADLKGTFEALDRFIEFFNISIKHIVEQKDDKIVPTMASLNSYDNCIYCNNICINPHVQIPYDLTINYDKLYFSNVKNIYINSIFEKEYSIILSSQKKNIELGSNDLLIYDVKDTFDEFSSRDIRKKFSMVFPKSYPAWRSILAGESCEDKDEINYVVDMTGKEYYISRLKRKNGLFVHCGPIELPPFFDKYSEKDFLNNYIELYEEKYEIEYSDIIKSDMRNSGKLFKLLLEKNSQLQVFLEGNHYEHEYCYISYDEEIFNECLEEFIYKMELAQEDYPLDNTVYVVPDFLSGLCKNHVVTNKMLMIGANVIKERVINHKIAWYEQLPKLSLEIINNGYYDTLMLVENQECENIIGKSFGIDVKQEFTLTAGEEEYILPLNKSFIGEQNLSFVAKLRDSSFPLKNDIKVKIQLKYSFGSENSYELSFIPIDKNAAPFKKIVAEWELEEFGDILKTPSITDVIYTDEWADKIMEFVRRNIDKLDSNYPYFIKWQSLNFTQYKNFMDNVRKLSNDVQRLVSYDVKYIEIINNYLEGKHTIDTIKHIRKMKVKEENPRNFHDICSMEEAIVMLTLDRDRFIQGKLKYPIACYGRYLSMHPEDDEVIEMALHQMEIFAKRPDYIQSNIPRKFIDRLTSGTACNHMFIKQLTDTNPIFTTSLLSFLINTMKYFAETDMVFDMNRETDNIINNPKENIMHMRYILEILISYLFARDSVYFEELKPGGKYAREIIYYLKEFNKKYVDAMSIWPEDRDKPRLKMKYKMVSKNKPKKLYNVWDELYCVILYLSGSEDVNYIVIETDN